jgi:hypothetical protein
MMARASVLGVRKGDGGIVEHRRTKVRCTHITIIRAYAANVRDRPKAEARLAQLCARQQTLVG